MITILCYAKCGTCRKALKWLETNKIEYNYRAIDQENPSKLELEEWHKKSGLEIRKFFNTSGRLYKEQDMKTKVKTLSEEELLQILSANGMMVKRPLVITDGKVLVGFKEAEWEATFLQH